MLLTTDFIWYEHVLFYIFVCVKVFSLSEKRAQGQSTAFSGGGSFFCSLVSV